MIVRDSVEDNQRANNAEPLPQQKVTELGRLPRPARVATARPVHYLGQPKLSIPLVFSRNGSAPELLRVFLGDLLNREA